ncbi:nuclear transport factor 2 family protein [Microbulbifer sp. VTAC004]|uniref:nuclear transport factor 2 family protein n=1 Tax=Microbulbifer TaxID=48073 RepID=UPI000364D8C6|nr:nuclear transport factor 2 family protein [Microbulbifer variabilis]
MYRIALLTLSFLIANAVTANSPDDKKSIERAVLDYIESQHQVKPKLMGRGLDKKLAKRTYWKTKDGSEFIMETDYETMLWIAENYNKDGDKFPPSPRIDIDILDIDNRAASVKLSVDEWIDYMHLYKNDRDEWKIINVLWQYHDNNRHVSKK